MNGGDKGDKANQGECPWQGCAGASLMLSVPGVQGVWAYLAHDPER